MIDPKVLAETKARFDAREQERAETQRRIANNESFLQIDSPERTAQRVARLTAATPRALLQPALTEAAGPKVLERIIGVSDLIMVNFLDDGVHFARSVARIRLMDKGHTVGFGTGFMVSPRLLLTNHHVLHTPNEAAASEAEFNYQFGSDGRFLPIVTFLLEPQTFFVTDEHLDYTLVAVAERSLDGQELQQFDGIRLIAAPGKVLKGECVNIVQHPNGEPKQVALRANQVVDILDEFLHYQTDTSPGSSGSAVVNDQWEVVALHHSGVPRTDDKGNLLTRNGTIWQPGMSETDVDWIANEGIRISKIIEHVQAQTLSPAQDAIRRQMFAPPIINEAANNTREGQLPPFPIKPQPSVPQIAPTPEKDTTMPTDINTNPINKPSFPAPITTVNSGASVTLTVPLQITISLGVPTQASHIAPTTVPAPAPVAPALPAPVAPTVIDDPAGEADLQEALGLLEKARQRTDYYNAADDARARDTYYAGITIDGQSPTALFSALGDLMRHTHKHALAYQPSTYLYPWVDVHEDGNIHSIYNGKVVSPESFIRQDIQTDQSRRRLAHTVRQESTNPMSLEAQIDLLESSLPYNCEHVVPQSWFNKQLPMRGDLHHLFGCETHCNSFRGNIPYNDFDRREEKMLDECGENRDGGFEPQGGKGAVARATLYFLLRYPGSINNSSREYTKNRLPVLLQWHTNNPVSDYERHRNAAIFEAQGNRNPLIDHPEWADKIDFERGLG